MSAHISRPIGIFTFASALLALGAGGVAKAAVAADCLTAPGSSTPPNSHWYYRTDRTQQRKCWFLRAASQNSAPGPASVTGEASLNGQSASSAPHSFANFRAFLAQRTGTALSEQDVKKLYAEFLDWNRRASN